MDFDWYQATLEQHPAEIEREVAAGLDGCRETRSLSRGGNGYNSTISFLDGRGGEMARMLHGGNAHPNLRATGHRARAAVELIRRLWPEHRVTRMDAAVDYTGEGVFDHLAAVAREVADRNRLKTGLTFQPDLLERGRTYRIGSPTSPVLVRIYEKGLHEGLRGPSHDPDWTRMEIQIRPQKTAKARFAKASPTEAWGATRWTAQLLEAVMGQEPPRLDAAPKGPSEWERTQAVLVQQYGRHALDGGLRAAGAPQAAVSDEEAVDAYLDILRRDLLDRVRETRRRRRSKALAKATAGG